MDFTEFRTQYKLSRASLIAGETTDLEAVQTQLRHLADQTTGDNQQVAHKLINDLPATVAAAREPAPEPSPEMLEARRIINEGKFNEGTNEEQLAAYDAARKKIWAIADRAGTDSSQIRYLTRRFESTELHLEEGSPWDDPSPNSAGA